MGRTLLIGNAESSWKEWAKKNRNGCDWICLDPAESSYGYLARLALSRGEKTVGWRFYGSLDPQRYPHVLLAGLVQLLNQANDDAIVQLFSYQPNPILRHTAVLAAQIVQPERLLIAPGTAIDFEGWPVGPEEAEPEKALPLIAIQAQRKANWLKLIENCEPHEVDLREVAIEGARLGSGVAMDEAERASCGLANVQYAEICGTTLFVVSPEALDEDTVSRALAMLHCSRIHVADPTAYENLICSFARQDGEDFGLGLIQKIEFATGLATIQCTAIPKAPVRLLRLGALRIDPKGNELGEVRPWQV
jgi:hypothetical protein